MMVRKSSYYRGRIELIKELFSNANDFDKKLLSNGFLPVDEHDQEIRNRAKTQSNEPLNFVEISSYSTWFAMHPEKIAGIEITTTSNAFPIKTKGKKEDIQNMFAQVFGEANENEAIALAIALEMELELMNI